MRLLLASNSTPHGGPVLSHLDEALAEHFDGARRIGFIGFAKADLGSYADRVRPAFERLGLELVSLRPDRVDLTGLDGVYVGGGNTWLLVRQLRVAGWMKALRAAAHEGLPYAGASAGTNIATPSLRTTNDMPIVEPGGFDTLGLVPFQINPHYLDPDPTSTHQGETREKRIAEFHEHHPTPVLGLREGSWLTVRDAVILHGPRSARWFVPGDAGEIPSGTRWDPSSNPEHLARR